MSQFRRRDRRIKTTRIAPKPLGPQNPQATSGLDPLEQRVLFTVLSAPTGLAGASNGSSEIDLNWNDSNGETSYKLQQQTLTTWNTVDAPVADTTSDAITGLTPGKAYAFRLIATNADGDSLPSTTATVTTLPDIPVLTATATTGSSTSVTLTWPAVAGATGYKLDRSTDLATWTQINAPTAATLTYADTGRTANTTYYYRLRASDASGDGDYSLTATATTNLAAPTGLLATPVSSTQVALTWPKVTGAFGYQVEKLVGSTWTALGGTLSGSTSTYLVSGLTANTAYSFHLKAVNGAGASVAGTTVATTTQTGVATLTSTSATTTTATINWTAVVGATGYKLERSTNNANWTQIATPTAVTLTYADSGLTAGTEYFYRLRVSNAGGDSAYSAVISQRTLLAAPTTVTATSTSGTSITLSWDAQAAASGFKLEEQTGQTWTQIGDVIPAGSTGYVVTGLTANTAYTFRLKATDDGGDSLPSTTTSATTRTLRTRVTGTASTDTTVPLTWTAVTGATGYKVEKSSDNVTFTTVTTTAANATTYTVTGLTADTGYYFRVQVTNAGGDSTPSNVLTRRTLLSAPANVVATGSSTTAIGLAWDQDTGDAGYIVQKHVNSTWVTLATLATDTNSYSVAGLKAGTSYSFRIMAINGGGISAPSATATAITYPGATVAKALAAGTTSITVSWTPLPGVATYEVDQSANGTTGWASAATPTVGTNSATITGLTADTPYYFRVFGVNAAGNGANSAVVHTSTLLAAPTTFAASSISDSQVVLSWDAQATATGFRLQKQVASNWVQVGALIPALSTATTVGGLTTNTAYSFRLTAVNAGGDSAVSTTATTTTKLVSPVLTAGAFTDTTANVSWTAVTNATGYKLERTTDPNGTWTQIVAPLPAVLTYADTGLTANTTYYYRLKATNAGGDSVPSAMVTQSTLMTAPTGLTATANEVTSIDLAWTLVPGATGYKVEQVTGATWGLVGSVLGGNVNSLNVASLNAATSYSFRVKVVDSAGDSLPSTTATTSTLAAAPELAAVPASTTAVTLTWAAVTGGTGFKLERSTDGGTWTQIATPTAATLTYSDTARTADTEYFYRLRVSDAGGDSAYSPVCSTTTNIAAPAGVTATSVSASRIDLAWTAQTTATGFKVQQQTGTTWTQVGEPLAAGSTSASITGLTTNTAYTFRVVAMNDGGDSAASSTVTATTSTAASKIKGSAMSDTQVNLTWTAVTGATGYKIQHSTDGTTYTTLATLGATVTAYSDTGLTANTDYYYRVLVTNAGHDSAPSNVILRHTLLAAPANVVATQVSATEIDLAWDQSTGNTGYTIEKLLGNTWVFLANVATDTHAYDVTTGLFGGTNYSFRVRALNAGGTSAPSTVASAATA